MGKMRDKEAEGDEEDAPLPDRVVEYEAVEPLECSLAWWVAEGVCVASRNGGELKASGRREETGTELTLVPVSSGSSSSWRRWGGRGESDPKPDPKVSKRLWTVGWLCWFRKWEGRVEPGEVAVE